MARVFISHSSRDGESASRIKHWLAQQGFETPFLDFDKHSGITPGSDWEKTLYREIERSEALIIVQTPNWMESKWCFAEYTQARALGKPIFPIIETATGDTLIAPDIQALNLLQDREGGLEQLARELTRIAMDAQGGFDWDVSRAPYPGLLAFQESDAAIYFGRDDEIRRLIERLNARRAQGGTKLIALLGASGSGKSSLLRAGVIPRIRRDKRNWIVLPPMRPQRHPIDELARTIAIMLDTRDWRTLRDRLNGPDVRHALSDLASDLRIWAGANEANILIPVDQAEELFGVSNPDEAAQFLKVISAAMSEDLPFLAVFSQRSDYLEALQSAPTLTARFEEFSLGPLPLSRVPQIIEGPARVAGISLEDGLVQMASRDAETEDALPLLAFALRELYDRSAGDRHFSLSEYMAMGDAAEGLTPLENAVRKAADSVIADAAPREDELAALRDAFVPAMVKVNDTGEYARNPARWDALPARSHPLLEKLARARLLILSQDGDARMVEVAHEALLRKWPRLRNWLDEARDFLVGRQQIDRDMLDWQRAAKADKPAALLTGLKLTRARSYLSERAQQLSDDQRAFIAASISKADADEKRRQRGRRRVTQLFAAAALVMAGIAGFSGWQYLQLEKASDQRIRDVARYAWTDLAAKVTDNERMQSLAQQYGFSVYNSAAEQPDGFDCNTRLEAGFRHLYCSLRSVISYDRVRSISGMDIYVSGPHTDELNLSAGEFGHYNPEFLDWADTYIIPAEMADPVFAAHAQRVYEAQLRDIARALFWTHEILIGPPEYRQEMIDYYRAGRGQEHEWTGWGGHSAETAAALDFDAMVSWVRAEYDGVPSNQGGGNTSILNDYIEGALGGDGYMADTATPFWVRRTIDGTEAQVFELLVKVLRCFDPEVLGSETERVCESEDAPSILDQLWPGFSLADAPASTPRDRPAREVEPIEPEVDEAWNEPPPGWEPDPEEPRLTASMAPPTPSESFYDIARANPSDDPFNCRTYLDTGFRSTYCAIRGVVSYPVLSYLSGVDMYLSGPHSGILNLDSQTFGAYNPDFLYWAEHYVVPAEMADDSFAANARRFYLDRFQGMARGLYWSHELLMGPQSERDAFAVYWNDRGEPEKGQLDWQAMQDEFLRPDFSGQLSNRSIFFGFYEYFRDTRGLNDMSAWTAGSFWVRRSIDGTAPQIFAMLETALNCYDPEVMGRGPNDYECDMSISYPVTEQLNELSIWLER